MTAAARLTLPSREMDAQSGKSSARHSIADQMRSHLGTAIGGTLWISIKTKFSVLPLETETCQVLVFVSVMLKNTLQPILALEAFTKVVTSTSVSTFLMTFHIRNCAVCEGIRRVCATGGPRPRWNVLVPCKPSMTFWSQLFDAGFMSAKCSKTAMRRHLSLLMSLMLATM